MMKSESLIATTQAQRLAKRLSNHWKHKFNIYEDSTIPAYKIDFPTAQVHLQPQADALLVRIHATQADTDFDRLEVVVLEHLSRMGQDELSATWQRS